MSARVSFTTVIERSLQDSWVRAQPPPWNRSYRAYTVSVDAEIFEGADKGLYAAVALWVKVKRVDFGDGDYVEPLEMILELTSEEAEALEAEALRRL